MTEVGHLNSIAPIDESFVPSAPSDVQPLTDQQGADPGSDPDVRPPLMPTAALERRRQRIALVEEFGGPYADLKKAAHEAILRGMYSPRTNRGDIESSLLRTWKHRHRDYQR